MSKIICLTPVKNGEVYIKNFFKENDVYIDFYIFLNDNSIDTTVSLLKENPKVLSILHRESADIFDDLINRNLLLTEAQKFANSSDWIIWLDIDEVLFNFKITDTNSIHGVLNLQMVHLWNSTTYYNTEYPYSDKGIQYKIRGFKVNNLVNWILPSTNRLHFPLLPSNYNNENILIPNGYILHYANVTKENREARYIRYKKDDPDNKFQSIGYNHLLNHNPKLNSIFTLEI
jgi:hypothetical protein